MKVFFLFAMLLSACATTSHQSRRLSEQERLALGLTGIIYDAPICHRVYSDQAKDLVEAGPCELVTCEQKGKDISCEARPQ
jgi:hypothetical protein